MVYFWLWVLVLNQFLAVLLFQRDGNILLQDNFSTRSNRWSLEKTAKLSIEYRNEQLQMKIISPGVAAWSVPDTDLRLSHYRLTVYASVLDSSPQSAVGVIFNVQDEQNFYLLEAQPEGKYALRIVEDGVPRKIPLAQGGLAPAEEFYFDLTIVDGEFTFTINDAPLPTVQDDAFRQGIFGLYARAGRGLVQVAFDDFRVLDVPSDD